MTAPRIADHFQSVDQTAQAWGCSRQYVLRMVNERRVDAQWFAGSWFVPKGTPKPPRLSRFKHARYELTANGRRALR